MIAIIMNKKERGFTLLEIMISLGILSIIFILIYGTFNSVYQGSLHTERDADRYRLTRLGIYHLSSDLTMVYSPPSLTVTAGKSESASLIFKGEDREQLDGILTFPNDSLQFSTVSHRRTGVNAPESDQTTIRYSLQDKILIKEAILSNGKTLTNEIGGPIDGLNFRYLDRGENNWILSWNADEKDQKPPLAVEIEFILKQGTGEPHSLKTWVDIPMGLRS